ncbi:hypothetical protein [Cyanobium sp. LEGE 06113]|uniref:hypothetical protein n=1 Tax=Cyanobium sp. LEGE 06113 TaxID=1297573 RepID=UPI00187DDB74|nr:hypothetical protein [Cyanobium sp. LEGE 06113]MBE9155174.1 hypothetical protein [Cyanobium sp. LEGE 06113]
MDPSVAHWLEAGAPGAERQSILLEHAPPDALSGALLSPVDLAVLTGYSERRIRQLAEAAAMAPSTIDSDGQGEIGTYINAVREPLPLLFSSGQLLVDPQRRDAFAIAAAPWPFLTEPAPARKRGRPATRKGASSWQFQRCPVSALVTEWVELPDWWPEQPPQANRPELGIHREPIHLGRPTYLIPRERSPQPAG